MPNGVIGNTTDSGSVKSRFEPWLGNHSEEMSNKASLFFVLKNIKYFLKICKTYYNNCYLCN